MTTCEQYDTLYEPLTNFSQATDAAICPFTADAGAGLGVPLFGLFVFGFIGLGLTIRVQHPAPILVAAILSAGLVAGSIPGTGATILALVLFFGLSGLGLYLYKRAQTSL